MSRHTTRTVTHPSVRAWEDPGQALRSLDGAVNSDDDGRIEFDGLVLGSGSRLSVDAPRAIPVPEVAARRGKLAELTVRVRRAAAAAEQTLADAQSEFGIHPDRLEHRHALVRDVEGATSERPPGDIDSILRLKELTGRLDESGQPIEIPVTTIHLV